MSISAAAEMNMSGCDPIQESDQVWQQSLIVRPRNCGLALTARFILSAFLFGPAFVAAPAQAASDAQWTINTIAGLGDTGDGGLGVDAILRWPYDVEVGPNGNLFIVDFRHNAIRKLDTDGVISTFAGTGIPGPGGDGGPATQAQLAFPRGMMVDDLGNAYIADTGNNRVRKIDLEGSISTIAGTGSRGYSGDGGTALEAQLASPESLASDSDGNLYIVDRGNNVIRKLDVLGNITTVAGSGVRGFGGDGGPAVEGQLAFPRFVAIDHVGNLYISDDHNHRIRRVDTAGIISTFAGTGERGFSGDGGQAVDAQISNPRDMAFDKTGNLIFVDSNNRIRSITPSGIIGTVAGSMPGYSGDGGPALDALLRVPWGLDVDDDGNVYFTDRNNNAVRKIDRQGYIQTVAGGPLTSANNGDGANAIDSRLDSPTDVAVSSNGRVYIADRGAHTIRMIDQSGMVSTVAGAGQAGHAGDTGLAATFELTYPENLAMGPFGALYISDTGNHRVLWHWQGKIWTLAGTGEAGYIDGGSAIDSQLLAPAGLAVTNNGTVYIADRGNGRVRKVTAHASIRSIAGAGGRGYGGDGGPALDAQLNFASGMATDVDGNVYIADTLNQRVRMVDAAGNISTIAGTGQRGYGGDGGLAVEARLNNPFNVATDMDRNVYIADSGNHRIRMVDSAGRISTIAGNGRLGPAGDGGSATEASVAFPRGLAIDAHRKIYIAEEHNARIRVLTPATSPVP